MTKLRVREWVVDVEWYNPEDASDRTMSRESFKTLRDAEEYLESVNKTSDGRADCILANYVSTANPYDIVKTEYTPKH